MEYNRARHIADRLVAAFNPVCDKVHVAGSVRREHFSVGDIEIVCAPKRMTVQKDFFETGEVIIPEFEKVVKKIALLILSGQVDGRMMKIIINGTETYYNPDLKRNGMKLDLFMPTPEDYFRILAIRTGSADFSHHQLAVAWKRKGWVGTEDGLRMERECLEMSHNKWKCINPNPTLPPEWQSEEDFFEWIELPWVEPKYRTG